MTQITCAWTYDDTYDYWQTACEHAFSLIDGTPAENKMWYCPFCGRRIIVVIDNEVRT